MYLQTVKCHLRFFSFTFWLEQYCILLLLKVFSMHKVPNLQSSALMFNLMECENAQYHDTVCVFITEPFHKLMSQEFVAM